MKKFTIILPLMAVMAVGCQENLIDSTSDAENTKEYIAISAVPYEASTKTSMDENGYVYWSAGDQLAVFQGCDVADKYQLKDGAVGTSRGIFEMTTGHDSDTETGKLSTNVAVYPYADNMSCKESEIANTGVKVFEISGFEFPEVQEYVPGSFGEGTFPMVAVTDDISGNMLKFRSVAGAIMLKLKGTQKIKSIIIEGRNNEKLSGAATITAYSTDYALAITMSEDATYSVALDCGDGVQLSENIATEFIIALPPVLFSKGFNVTVIDSNDESTKIETWKTNAVVRSSALEMSGYDLTDNTIDDAGRILVGNIKLNKESLTMAPTTSFAIIATVTPVDTTKTDVMWMSEDASIASVDQTGIITAMSVGATVIYAIADGVVKECPIVVIECAVPTID